MQADGCTPLATLVSLGRFAISSTSLFHLITCGVLFISFVSFDGWFRQLEYGSINDRSPTAHLYPIYFIAIMYTTRPIRSNGICITAQVYSATDGVWRAFVLLVQFRNRIPRVEPNPINATAELNEATNLAPRLFRLRQLLSSAVRSQPKVPPVHFEVLGPYPFTFSDFCASFSTFLN